MAKRWTQVTSDVLTTFLEGFKSKKVNMEVETSFGLRSLVPEEGIVMPVGIGVPEGIGVLDNIGAPENIGALGYTGVLEQRVVAGGSCPLRVDEERGDQSLKEAQDCFPHRRCEGVP